MVMADLFLKSNIKFAVAHCNFGLRAEASDKDAQLVREWCAANDVEFHNVRFDTKQKSREWKKGIQETARILRYEWFETVRKEHGYTKIVTAHHANDNVEKWSIFGPLIKMVSFVSVFQTNFLILFAQKSLAENVRSFELMKDTEKKKLDEERKWVRREKALFEKSVKDKKSNFERRAQDEVEELQNKVTNKTLELELKCAIDLIKS